MMAEPLGKDTSQFSSDLPVGEILRRTRVHYGQSLQDVEANIRIRAHLIEALENNDVDKMPARVYAIGFVRSYSQYLGLDGDKMVQLFKSQAGGVKKDPELFIPVTASEQKNPPVWLVVGSLLILMVLAGLWAANWESGRAGVEEIPPVPREVQEAMYGKLEGEEEVANEVREMQQAEASAQPASEAQAIEGEGVEVPEQTGVQAAPAAPEEAAGAAVSPEVQAAALGSDAAAANDTGAEAPAEKITQGIMLIIRENSWVEIRGSNGRRIISRVLKSGDRYYVPDRPDLVMSLGNAGGVDIKVDGIALRPLGADAQVRRNIPLDAAYLKQNFSEQ